MFGNRARLLYSYKIHIDIVGVRSMAATATLSSKFQISIPKVVREEQHWEAGQEFLCTGNRLHAEMSRGAAGLPCWPLTCTDNLS